MGIIQSMLSSIAGGKEFIDTGLKSISGNSKVVLTVDRGQMSKTLDNLSAAIKVDLPIERIHHLQLLDEYQSATVEGARTTIEAVMSGCNTKSEIMVRQSLAGLQYALNNSITEDNLIRLWKIVTDGCCDNKSAGISGYRTGMVYVGNSVRVIHTPPSPDKIKTMMDCLLNYRHELVLVNVAVLGFYFVYVHPFADGNGRVSRILMQKELCIPGLPLSKAISCNISNYYKSLQASEIERNGVMDITPFYEYMLSVINSACSMYMLYTKPLDRLQSMLISKMDKAGGGYIGFEKAADILDSDVPTAVNVISSLAESGYLEYQEAAGSYKLIWR